MCNQAKIHSDGFEPGSLKLEMTYIDMYVSALTVRVIRSHVITII